MISVLYYSVSDVRAIYVGHFPTSMMIHVVVVNPFQNRELSPHILERHFYEACQTLSGQKITQKEGISFKVRSLFPQNSINRLALVSFLSCLYFGSCLGGLRRVHQGC